jgi:hypothetical protein
MCSLKTQDVNYAQNFTLSIQNSLLLNQYIAGIDWKVFENSHCTRFVESHLKLRYIPFGCPGWTTTAETSRILRPQLANRWHCRAKFKRMSPNGFWTHRVYTKRWTGSKISLVVLYIARQRLPTKLTCISSAPAGAEQYTNCSMWRFCSVLPEF